MRRTSSQPWAEAVVDWPWGSEFADLHFLHPLDELDRMDRCFPARPVSPNSSMRPVRSCTPSSQRPCRNRSTSTEG